MKQMATELVACDGCGVVIAHINMDGFKALAEGKEYGNTRLWSIGLVVNALNKHGVWTTPEDVLRAIRAGAKCPTYCGEQCHDAWQVERGLDPPPQVTTARVKIAGKVLMGNIQKPPNDLAGLVNRRISDSIADDLDRVIMGGSCQGIKN